MGSAFGGFFGCRFVACLDFVGSALGRFVGNGGHVARRAARVATMRDPQVSGRSVPMGDDRQPVGADLIAQFT